MPCRQRRLLPWRCCDDDLFLFAEALDAEPDPVADLQEAAAAHADALRRPGADHVAGQQRHEARDVADDFGGGYLDQGQIWP